MFTRTRCKRSRLGSKEMDQAYDYPDHVMVKVNKYTNTTALRNNLHGFACWGD